MPRPNPNMTFAEWLEEFLLKEQLTARDFAAKIGVHESMVSKFRNGVKPSAEIIDRIATRYGVPLEEIPRHNEAERADNPPAPEEESSHPFDSRAAPLAVFDSVPDHIVLNWGVQKGFFAQFGLSPAGATKGRFDYPNDVLKLIEEGEKVLFIVPVSDAFLHETVHYFFLSNRYKGHALIARADALLEEVRFGADALTRFRDLFNRIISADALWQVAILNKSARDFYGLVVQFFFEIENLEPPSREDFDNNLQALLSADNEGLINHLRELGSRRRDFIMGHAFTAARARITDDPKSVLMKEILNWDSMIAVIEGLGHDQRLRARFKMALATEKGLSPQERDKRVTGMITDLQERWRKKFDELRLPVVWGITNAALEHILAEKKGKYADKTELLRALSKAALDTVHELKRNPRGVEEVSDMLVTHQRGYNEQRVFWRSLKEQMPKVWHKSYQFLDEEEREKYLTELIDTKEGLYVGRRELFRRIKDLLPPR